MREGVVATGAFFTFLPSAYTDEARARENANKTHGPDAHVLAVDTALVPDVSLWQPDASDPGRMAVWGLIPPRALSEVQPESIPTL